MAGIFFISYALIIGGSTVTKFGTDFVVLRLAAKRTQQLRHYSFLLLVILISFTAVGLLVTVYALVSHTLRTQFETEMISVILVVGCILPQAIVVTAGAYLRGRGTLVLGTLFETGLVQLLALVLVISQMWMKILSLNLVLLDLFTTSWAVAITAIIVAGIKINRAKSDQQPESYITYFREFKGLLFSTGAASSLFYFSSLLPLLILNTFSSSSEVAFFSIAQRIAALILLLPALQITTSGPFVARAMESRNKGEVNSLIRAQIRASLVAALPLVLSLFVFSQKIVVTLFGKQYSSAAPIVIVMGFLFYISLICGNSLHFLQIAGLEKKALLISALGVLAWVILGIPFAVVFGGFGVAVVAGLILVISGISGAILLSRITGIQSLFCLGKETAY